MHHELYCNGGKAVLVSWYFKCSMIDVSNISPIREERQNRVKYRPSRDDGAIWLIVPCGCGRSVNMCHVLTSCHNSITGLSAANWTLLYVFMGGYHFSTFLWYFETCISVENEDIVRTWCCQSVNIDVMSKKTRNINQTSTTKLLNKYQRLTCYFIGVFIGLFAVIWSS